LRNATRGFMHIGAPRSMARINHAQIAAAARVSRSTVSRALQNHPALPASTRERIQKLAQTMGYRPNPLVSALMATRNRPQPSTGTTTLAVLTCWRPTVDIAPFTTDRRYLSGAQQRAEELGFRFEEFWLDEPGVSGRRLEQILTSRGIVAVMFAPIPAEHPKIDLTWECFSLAAFGPSTQIPILNQASHFHFRSCCMAVRELLKLGYRRPALFVPTDIPLHVRDQWIGGHYSAAVNLPLRDRLAPYLIEDFTADAIVRWCQARRPDAILSNEPRIYKWLKAANLDKSIAYANLDHHPEHEGMAGVDQLHELVGRAAVDIVVAQFNRNERGIPRYPRDILIEGRWVPGPSAPPV
jgi:LacI family transcriptional regulator